MSTIVELPMEPLPRRLHPANPDDLCRFTIVSLWEDHAEVGELRKYKDTE